MSKKYRQVQESKQMDSYDLEGTLDAVIVTLQAWKLRFGAAARVSLWNDNESYGTKVELSWTRQETDKERDTRLKQAQRWRKRIANSKIEAEAQEKLEYKRLKEKYG
jgi:hypothetical protein